MVPGVHGLLDTCLLEKDCSTVTKEALCRSASTYLNYNLSFPSVNLLKRELRVFLIMPVSQALSGHHCRLVFVFAPYPHYAVILLKSSSGAEGWAGDRSVE